MFSIVVVIVSKNSFSTDIIFLFDEIFYVSQTELSDEQSEDAQKLDNKEDKWIAQAHILWVCWITAVIFVFSIIVARLLLSSLISILIFIRIVLLI